MKILHTSDWHIGRTLYGKKRYEEFELFFNWMAETILHNEVDALLVAGDVFDSTMPSNRAMEIYYRFLRRVTASSCRYVVIIGGNHDSSSLLNAPRELLKILDVHVVGNACENLADEVLILNDTHDMPALIVCAVPYLRDRDIRIAQAGESMEDKERKLMEGIRSHYAATSALAEQKRSELGVDIPLVVMGHLFTAGGQIADEDGVRDLYVGSMAHVPANIFPERLNYLALGHLHVPQKVNGSDVMRYSGSPLPIGFGEATQQKSVCLVEFNGTATTVKQIDVPVFQRLERIRGDLEQLYSRIRELSAEDRHVWLEVIYEGNEVVGDLRERLEAVILNKGIEILRLKNTRIIDRVLGKILQQETLDDLNVDEVFERCLTLHEISEEQRPELLSAYKETLLSLNEDETMSLSENA